MQDKLKALTVQQESMLWASRRDYFCHISLLFDKALQCERLCHLVLLSNSDAFQDAYFQFEL